MSVKQDLQPFISNRDLLPFLQPTETEEEQPSEPGQLVGRILNQRYVLDELIGCGATSWVFKARDLRKVEVCSTHPYVAIKVLRLDLRAHPEARVGLEREAARSQQLNHPGIVSVFDFNRDGGLFYLVMEWISGPTLENHIPSLSGAERRSPRTRRIIRGLLEALRYAHGKGVIHADFKPANVIIDNSGLPRILDFGVARMTYSLAQTQGMQAGFNGYTPTYASKSRLKGGAASVADDTYGLACVIYELLTGRHPYGRRTALEASQQGIRLRKPRGLDRKTWRVLAQALDTESEQSGSLRELAEAFADSGYLRRHRLLAHTVLVSAAVLTVILNGAHLERWAAAGWYRLAGERDFLHSKLSALPVAQREFLWAGVGRQALAELETLQEKYRQLGDLHVLVEAHARAGDWLQAGVEDARLVELFRWLEQERIRVLYPDYLMLNRVLPSSKRRQMEPLSELDISLGRLRLLNPAHPALNQGAWLWQLHQEVARALAQGRWSESLVLAESGLGLVADDPYLTQVRSHLLSADHPSLATIAWPEPSGIDVAIAASEMLVGLIRNGLLDEARREYRYWAGLEGFDTHRLLARLRERYQQQVLADPPVLAVEALSQGQQFFAELAADRERGSQGLRALQAAALELVDVIERNASSRAALKEVEDQLNRLAVDEWRLREGQSYLRQLLQRQLAWHQGQRQISERYRATAQALLPQEDWSPQESLQEFQCRDVPVSGQRLISLCRDQILPTLMGPELVLVSDLSRRRAFYLSRHEISVGEYNLYCRLSQECKPRGEPEALPLTRVSYREASSYSRWLSRVTGQQYRLPLLDEWLLAAEQGEAVEACRDTEPLAEVQSGVVDRLGLLHLAGNVREFVLKGSQLQVRGGSVWDGNEPCSVSYGRIHNGQADRHTGFRLVREVNAGS